LILFLDTETFCETPIRHGTHAYAEKVEIIVESWAIDDGPVMVADCTAGQPGPFALHDPEDFDAIVMHRGGMFDRIVYRHAHGVEIPPHLIHDTEVQARSHGLPGGLEKLCAIYQVPAELTKHAEGKHLIQMFCKPQPKNQKLRRKTRDTHPIEWQRFLDYAGGDIHAMRYLFHRLPRWNYPNREHPLWVLDQQINDRGFKVDLELARSAIAMVAAVKKEVDADTYIATDGRVRSTTQRDALLEELLFEFGVKLPDMQSSTIERRLEDPDLPEAVKDLLSQRLLTSVTSTAKYNRILDAVSSDGRLRGSIQFCGAPRTKRDSGLIFQPQNLPRPDMPSAVVEEGIALMKSGAAGMLLQPDEAMRLAWNALRGLIVADEGRKIVQGDLSQIEARILPWLAEQDWKLQAFRDLDAGIGPDLYLVGAARILGKEVGAVTRPERQSHGKVPELACGYGGSVGAFNQFARLYRLDLPLHEIQDIVRAWREANFEIANWQDGLWVRLEEAARLATQNSNKVFEAGPYIRFERWRDWLRMQLPSGGFLSYASPHIGDHPHGGPNSLCFMGINNYTRRWEKLYTYGGKLSADATQATARELFAYNWSHVEDLGFPIVLRVHDELVTEPLDDPNYSVTKLMKAMTRRPPWIDDKLPLAAGGFEAYRYRKDD
jgi:DNA polymerase